MIFGFLHLLSMNEISICESCPKPELLKPCFCQMEKSLTNIKCTGNQEIDLKTLFHKLSDELEEKDKHFDIFFTNNTVIKELPENVFNDITFTSIHFQNASNLKYIHNNAFNASNSRINYFQSFETPLENYLPNYNLFKILSSMTNLISVSIWHSNLTEIPDEAFDPMNGLQKNWLGMSFGYNPKLEKIGENAFQRLEFMQFLDFYNNKISYVSKNAFSFQNNLNKTLRIALFGNKLNATSFQLGAFDSIKRPVDLELQFNNISYLDKRVFLSFITQNSGNTIKADSLACDDCRNHWLVDNNFNFDLNVLKCSNGQNASFMSSLERCVNFDKETI